MHDVVKPNVRDPSNRRGDPCGRPGREIPGASGIGTGQARPLRSFPCTSATRIVGATLVVARVGRSRALRAAGRDNAARRLARARKGAHSPSGPSPHRPRTPRPATALRAVAWRRLLGPSPTGVFLHVRDPSNRRGDPCGRPCREIPGASGIGTGQRRQTTRTRPQGRALAVRPQPPPPQDSAPRNCTSCRCMAQTPRPVPYGRFPAHPRSES